MGCDSRRQGQTLGDRRSRRGAWAIAYCVALASCAGATADGTKVLLLHNAARITAPSRDGDRDDAGPLVRTDAALGAEPVDAPSDVTQWPRERRARIETDWCIEKVAALDEAACYVLPDQPTRTLMIYFHGIVPPTKDSPQKSNFETVVANAARRAGIAALIPRGKKGLAPRGQQSWWGWPTTDASYDEHGPAMLAEVAARRTELEQIAGVSFSRVYVAGSSSGAYFVTKIAMRGGLEADGFAAISGGAPADAAAIARQSSRPFYIGYGKNDGAVRGSAIALAELLRRTGWPVMLAAHPVDHGAHEVYIDEAVAFFRDHER